LLHCPQSKEVRFAEFTANLLRALVRNIPICLYYCKHLSESNESNYEERVNLRDFLIHGFQRINCNSFMFIWTSLILFRAYKCNSKTGKQATDYPAS